MLFNRALVLPLLAAQVKAISTNFVLTCPVAYADGGLYLRETTSGSYTPDLGGLLPATETFQLAIAVTDGPDSTCCGPDTFYLAKKTASNTFQRFNLQPYIDLSAGAVSPIAFTSDNSTLEPGQTTFGWMDVYGFLMWSPTGHLKDVYPPPAADGSQVVAPNQGFQLASTDYSGIFQLVWNQAVFESNQTTSTSHAVGQCFSSTDATFDDDLGN